MEQTIKNMKTVAKEIYNESIEENVQSTKTLTNTYRTLLQQLKQFPKSDILQHKDELLNQKRILEQAKAFIDEDLTKMLNEKNYKSADNLAIASERLGLSIRDLRFVEEVVINSEETKNVLKTVALMERLKNEEIKNYKLIDEMIEFSLKHKILVQMQSDQYRGIGKSTRLSKKADELGAMLIVPFESTAKILKEKGFKNVMSLTSGDLSQGKRFANGFIVDEGVKLEVIKALIQGNEFLGGISTASFANINKL